METISIIQADSDGKPIDEIKINLINHGVTKPTKLFIQTDAGIICCLRLEEDVNGAIKIKLEEFQNPTL